MSRIGSAKLIVTGSAGYRRDSGPHGSAPGPCSLNGNSSARPVLVTEDAENSVTAFAYRYHGETYRNQFPCQP